MYMKSFFFVEPIHKWESLSGMKNFSLIRNVIKGSIYSLISCKIGAIICLITQCLW